MKRNFKMILALICLTLGSCKTQKEPKGDGAKISQQAPNFEGGFEITPRFDLQTNRIVVNIKLIDGLHAYGELEEIGRPVALNISPSNGWELKGNVLYPKGEVRDLGQLGKSHVYFGDFEISQKLKKGCDEIEGELLMQVCTDHSCDRPRTHSFTLESKIPCAQ